MNYLPPENIPENTQENTIENIRLQEQLEKMKLFREKQLEKEANKKSSSKTNKTKKKNKNKTPTREGSVYYNKLKQRQPTDPNRETKERIKELTQNVNRKPVKDTITSLDPVKRYF